MGISIHELKKAPLDIIEGEAKDAERLDKFTKARNLRLTVEKAEKIEKELGKRLKAQKQQTTPLMKRLSRWSDMIEGVIDETNFPFEGASNVTLRYATGLARAFQAQFNKTMYGDEDLWYPVLDPGAEQALELDQAKLAVLAEAFNHSYCRVADGIESLKVGTIPAFRDGTYLIQGEWTRKIERVNDERTYRDLDSFRKDYPDAESGGVSLENYQAILDEFLVDDKPEVIVRFNYEAVLKDRPAYEPVLRAKFINYPTYVKRVEDMTLYGCFSEISKEEMKRRGENGKYYKRGVEKTTAKSTERALDTWDKARMFVEGRNMPERDQQPIRIATLVAKLDLDDDDVVEKYLATVATDGEYTYLLAIQPYDLRRSVDRIVPFRLVQRDQAFDGISMIGDGEDIFNQVDVLFRHDNNVMMLTTSPMFLADAQLKDTIDLGRAENVIRPGVTYWVPNPDKMPIRQIPVQDIASMSGDNNSKLAILQRFLELLVGVTQALSGNQTPDDPRAPAHKAQMQMLQSNKRIDDNMDEWRASFSSLAQLHGTLMVQFSKESSYKFLGKDGKPYEIPFSLFTHPAIHWIPKRRSVTLTPEFALARIGTLTQTYMGMRPLLMQGDATAIELWNRTIQNSGEPQPEKFLYDPKQAPAMMQKSIEMAMKQAEMKSNMEAKAAGKKKLSQEAAKMAIKTMDEAARMGMAGGPAMQQMAQQDQQTQDKQEAGHLTPQPTPR